MGSDSGFELSSVLSALTDPWSKYRKASSVASSKPPAQLSGQTLTDLNLWDLTGYIVHEVR